MSHEKLIIALNRIEADLAEARQDAKQARIRAANAEDALQRIALDLNVTLTAIASDDAPIDNVKKDERERDIGFIRALIKGSDDELLIDSGNDALNRIIAGTGA